MASELCDGDALMPYYEDFKTLGGNKNKNITYKRVYNPNSGKYEYVHRLIGKEIKKTNEKHNTFHHRDFNRYNNIFSNLKWVDFEEHKKMHGELNKVKWQNPDFVEKLIKQNIERNSVSAMAWYNSSDLHKEHDEIRSKSLTARWENEESREELKSSMTIKVDENCFDLIVEEIKKYETFVNAEDFIYNLKNTGVYFLIKELNKYSKRNVDTFFNSKGNLRRILRENGIDNYTEFLQKHNPLLLELKKENYRNLRIEWNKNNLIQNEKGQYEYKNHKVLRTETIFEDDDVYCMTVVGNDGQHDRHNFALYSFDTSGNRTNSGVFVKNTFEEDYWLPIRGDKSSRIETLPGACLALDTKIELLDGRSLELIEIIREWDNGNKNLWSYSINPNTGEIVPGFITWAGVTRKNTQVVKITLDNGETITVTPDHKFPTKFNGKKEAKDLLIGESLWSFNKKFTPASHDIRKKRNDYEMIYDHLKNDWIFSHRMVANYFKETDQERSMVFNEKYSDCDKKTIHHYNFDRFNNSPENLFWMNNKDHYEFHQNMSKEWSKIGVEAWLNKYNNNENFRNEVLKKLKIAREEYYLNRTEKQEIKHNQSISDGINKYFNSLSIDDKSIRAKISANNAQKGSDKLQELLKDEDYKKAFDEKTSATLKIVKDTPEYKIKQSKISSELWKDYSFRNAVIEKQTIKYSNTMLQFVVGKFKEGLSAEEILKNINSECSLFMIEFNLLNEENKQLKKMKNGFTHNNLDKMMKHFGYSNWRDFKSKVEFFNHKIISIEWLEEKQDTGTITIDGNELYHNFHNFALTSGVFTSNSNLGDIQDIEYLQNKLFAALKVPKPYLNYAETIPGGSALSQPA